MFMAAMHNGISRLYETFGNAGADTQERILDPDEYARTWYKPNPPLPKVLWSQRNNNNYEQTGLLTALNYFADNDKQFLRNFYLKSKRSIEKPERERPGRLRAAGRRCASRRAGAAAARPAAAACRDQPRERRVHRAGAGAAARKSKDDDDNKDNGDKAQAKPKTVARTFAAGSYVVRMDQPYSRIADTLLDRQYWAPDDPQKHPYDDTAWSMGDLFGTEVVRVTDKSVLQASMEPLREAGSRQGRRAGHRQRLSSSTTTPTRALITLRYALKDADIDVADKGVRRRESPFQRRRVDRAQSGQCRIFQKADRTRARRLRAGGGAGRADAHSIGTPRIALMHTWIDTQTEGWWRMALDKLGVPYSYISTQTVAREDNLKSQVRRDPVRTGRRRRFRRDPQRHAAVGRSDSVEGHGADAEHGHRPDRRHPPGPRRRRPRASAPFRRSRAAC